MTGNKTANLFALCEKGNHFYGLKEYDRALYYYEQAINKGYDGLQIIQRAQRLKEQGIKPKPAIDIGRARRLIKGLRQDHLRQFVFVKANYPDRLIASLKALINCTIEPKAYKIEETPEQVNFFQEGKPVMVFEKKDARNNRPCMQFFWEMEKYMKEAPGEDGRTVRIPAKRRKYHFVIVYDTFTDLLVHLRRVHLFKEPYYEEHRDELFNLINDEFKNYKQPQLRLLGHEFIHWLECFSVLNELFRLHSDKLEYDYLKEYIGDTIDYFVKMVDKEAIFKVDFIFMMLVLLEKLYERFPSERRDKFKFLYTKYMVCKKFDDAFQEFFKSVGQDIITEPKLHEFTKSIKPFRAHLFKT
ncbi:MAG: hypothetical protein Q6373_009280 [Candidatus Sigynarchaeota archaeon]